MSFSLVCICDKVTVSGATLCLHIAAPQLAWQESYSCNLTWHLLQHSLLPLQSWLVVALSEGRHVTKDSHTCFVESRVADLLMGSCAVLVDAHA